MRETLKKTERLCKKEELERLYEEGKSFNVHPFRVIWSYSPTLDGPPAQVVFSVPKRRVRKAHDRNRVKRLMKEAYRKNKKPLYEALAEADKKLSLMLMYNTSNSLEYREVEGKIILSLQRLIKECCPSK